MSRIGDHVNDYIEDSARPPPRALPQRETTERDAHQRDARESRKLADLNAVEAIGPMLRALAQCDPMAILYSTIIHAVTSFGAPALEPTLAAYATAESDDQRAALAEILAGLEVHDGRILALKMLDQEPDLAAGLLAQYGDPAALPSLSAALDRCELDERGGLFVNQDLIELEGAIEELGGELNERQKRKVRAVESARREARAPLLAVDSSELDDDDDVDDGELAEVVDRFVASLPADDGAHDVRWIELLLQYGAEYEGVSFSDFDDRVLRTVLFDLFPRKVSCDASAAPQIIASLRAFWIFARDVTAHPHAEACLAELGCDAPARLARLLADPSNFGLAKSFVMGSGAGPRLGLGHALPSGRKEEERRKKKARKLKKKAQRRNRR